MVTSVDRIDASIPLEFNLSQNYPNPFNPNTYIRFEIPKDAFVTINIYDLNGKLVRNLVAEFKSAGAYRTIWDSRDDHGSKLTSGIYFYSLKAGEFSMTKKMTLLK